MKDHLHPDISTYNMAGMLGSCVSARQTLLPATGDVRWYCRAKMVGADDDVVLGKEHCSWPFVLNVTSLRIGGLCTWEYMEH